MRFFFKTALALMVIWLLLKPCLSQAQSKAVTIETAGGQTIVTMLEGRVFLVKEDLTRIRSLARGDYLKQNDEEWTYIVSAMQQINIQPDGTPSEPFRFSAEADLDEWVRWNRDRDR